MIFLLKILEVKLNKKISEKIIILNKKKIEIILNIKKFLKIVNNDLIHLKKKKIYFLKKIKNK